MNPSQLSVVLAAGLCLLSCIRAAPLASHVSGEDHASSHEIQERKVDSVEMLSGNDISTQCCKRIGHWSSCCLDISFLQADAKSCVDFIQDTRYKDPDHKKCNLRLKQKEEARGIFKDILHMFDQYYIESSIRTLEHIINFIEDPLTDSYDDKYIKTPQQILAGIKKWYFQFVEDPKLNCCQPFPSTFKELTVSGGNAQPNYADEAALAALKASYTREWSISLQDIIQAMEVVHSYKSLGNTSGKKSSCLRGCVGEEELYCVLNSWDLMIDALNSK